MPPKRPAETNKEAEEERQRVDESLNTENDLQTTAGPALTIPPALIETLSAEWQMRLHTAYNHRMQNHCLALTLRSSLPDTNQPRKLLTPKTKPSHWWSNQYFASVSPWQVSKTLSQGESSTPAVYQLTVRFLIKCGRRSGPMSSLIWGFCFQTRFLKTR